jgi:hypothetical protein
LLTTSVSARSNGRAVGPPISHTSVNVVDISGNVELDSSSEVKPGHSDIDSSWGNSKSVQKGLDEVFELQHLEIRNGRGVINKNPDIHLRVTFTIRGFGDGDTSPNEGWLDDVKYSAVFE